MTGSLAFLAHPSIDLLPTDIAIIEQTVHVVGLAVV